MEKIVVLLVGAQGSGKTTWCREHLSDYFRISQDEQGHKRHLELYEEALQRGELRIVIDRINGQKYQRQRYLEPAKHHGYTTRIVWLNPPRSLCLERCKAREDHPTLTADKAERAISLYFNTLQTPTRAEADSLDIVGQPPRYVPVQDIREEIGQRRYLIVGDIHGCFDELQQLLGQVDFDSENDVLISVGDLTDRGPKSKEVIAFLRTLPQFYMVLGNHDEKFIRYLKGNNVKIAQGLQETIDSFEGQFPDDLHAWLESQPLILQTPAGYVVHAGFDPEMMPDEQRRQDCIYMRFYGGRTYFDEINGQAWYDLWPKNNPRVFFGHIPLPEGPFADHIVSLDGGCVFGGELRLWDSRDGQLHRLPASKAYATRDQPMVDNPLSPKEMVKKREEYVQANLLRTDRTDDNTLAVYTYTDACVFENAWDEITRHARGHIYDLNTGECVAYPFPKFFNLGENQETLPENFPWDAPYEIMEKMDGWLGVLYRHQGQFKVATRGSFHSHGAVWATEYIQQFDLSCLPDEVTLCFEIITPDHRIILDYGEQRSLVILGAYNRLTGEEYPRRQVEKWSQETGLPIVPLKAHMSLEDLNRSKNELKNVEGFVIRFHDGRRVKVKTDWYLDLARILTNLSPISIWHTMKNGKVPEECLIKVPEELRPLAERYSAVLEGQYAQLRLEIEQTARPLLEEFGHDRRALAIHMNERANELKHCRTATFLMLDGKESHLDNLIMKLIYPQSNQFVEL